MPKTDEIEKFIPALWRCSPLNLCLFSYIRGVRGALHTITITQAIDMFMEEYGLDDDNFNRGSALTTYNRMQKFLINLKSET